MSKKPAIWLSGFILLGLSSPGSRVGKPLWRGCSVAVDPSAGGGSFTACLCVGDFGPVTAHLPALKILPQYL